jgi:hypothetical protein
MNLQEMFPQVPQMRKARHKNARTVDSFVERKMGEGYKLFIHIKQMDGASSFSNHDRVYNKK